MIAQSVVRRTLEVEVRSSKPGAKTTRNKIKKAKKKNKQQRTNKIIKIIKEKNNISLSLMLIGKLRV